MSYPSTQTCLHCDKEMYVDDDFEGYIICPECWEREGYPKTVEGICKCGVHNSNIRKSCLGCNGSKE